MAEYFMGQVMMTGFGYAPKFFAQCNGGTLSVTQNAALFSLLGIAYGGDGTSTFGIPDLRGRTPAGGIVSINPNWVPTPYTMGMAGGVEKVSLTADQNPQHTHVMTATTTAGTDGILGDGEVLASATANLYATAATLLPQTGGPTSTAGAGAAHENMQPFQTINFNIALTGIYPPRQ